MKRAAFARINLSNLKHNLAVIRKLASTSKVMAVVKADAYGHGMLEICKSLSDADAFSVAYINEALELRNHGIDQPILALQGFSNLQDLTQAILHDVQVVIHNQEQLQVLKSYTASTDLPPTLNIFVKCDTGMHRLGFAMEEFNDVVVELEAALSSESTLCLMTHLACADEVASQATAQQLQRFDELVKDITLGQSIANSAGVLAWPESHREWVRPGLVLYGINPLAEQDTQSSIELRPVMSLHAPIISIKHCKKGEKVGYGGDFCCPDDMLIGIIAIGYADGYPRHLKTAPSVLIDANRAPLIGRVSMDMIAVDLSGIETQVGNVAELWGESIPVEEVAKHAETISYELLCAAGNSVHKIYI